MVQEFNPRILHVLSSVGVSHGGTATSVVGLSHALQSVGNHVTIYSTDAATPARSQERRFGLMATDLPRNADALDLQMFSVKQPHRWLFAPEMGKALRKDIHKFDVVHINGLFSYPQFAAWSAASKASVPYVVSTHGNLDPYLRNHGRLQKLIANALWVRRMLNNASVIHCTTEEERDLISDVAPKTPRIVISNGMYVADFATSADASKFRNTFLTGSDSPLVLYHGRLAYKKGLDILIDAMSMVLKDHPNALLAIVGPDNEGLKVSLERQASDVDIRDSVIFTGELTGADLLDALSATDVWALPSHTENFGYAVVEAMAAGRPVVASEAVNIAPEAHAYGALTMVEVNAHSTASAITHLLNHPDEREALGRSAQLYVEKFDWKKVSDEYTDMYRNVIHSN